MSLREEERRRLYRNLHDILSPALASIRLRLDMVATRLAHEADSRVVADAAADVARAMEEIRRLGTDAGPLDLHWGLPGALRRLAARFEAAGVAITVQVPESAPQIPTAIEVAAYRIAAEGLANVIRHASARKATLRLDIDGDIVLLEVADDGVGLLAARMSRGSGLPSMTWRAQEVGGRCEVLPRADSSSGTVVRAILPGRAA